MPLLLKEKQELIEEIKSNIENNEIVLVASVEKMKVSDITELRGKLREGSVTLKMYKNTLIRHAMLQMDPDNEAFQKIFAHLQGPSALVFNKEQPLTACRLMTDKAREDARIGVKAAFFEGRYMDGEDVKSLASIGSKEMLLARLLGALKSPMTRLVHAMKSPQTNLALVLRAVAEKQGGGNVETPAASSEQPAASSEQPVDSSEQPVDSSEQPVDSSEQPAASSEQPVESSE